MLGAVPRSHDAMRLSYRVPPPGKEGARRDPQEGRGECRVPERTRSPCAKVESTRKSPQVRPVSPGIPCAMVLTVSSVLLCPKNLSECANGRFSQNRPSLDLSPFVLE